MYQLQAPPGIAFADVGDDRYTPGPDGLVTVMEESHLRQLKALGFTVPGDNAPAFTVIEDEFGNADMITKNNLLTTQVAELTGDNEDLTRICKEQTEVIAELEDRVTLLTAQLDGVTITGDGTGGEALLTPTEPSGGTTETQDGPQGGESTSEALKAPETPPPAPVSLIKEVDGIVVADAEAFEGMEYNLLKEWLKAHGVHAPANIKKAAAVKACQDRFAELTAK